MPALTNIAGFPILSLITWLPLAGCPDHHDHAARGRGNVASNARWTALWTSLLVLVLSLVLWVSFDQSDPGFQFNESVVWMPDFRVGYKMGVDGISVLFVLLSTLLTPICILSSWEPSRSRCGSSCWLPDPGNHDGRHVLRHRLRAVLHVLRGRADPDVPDHRHLGRPSQGLRSGQVFPLHAGRLGADAAGADRHVGAGGHHRHRHADAHGVLPAYADLAVPGVLRLLRGEGADVAGAHLVAGRACGGADGRLGYPGGRAAEDGGLRVPALLRARCCRMRPPISRR